MDTLLIAIVDGLFHGVGRGLCWGLRKLGLPVPEFGFYGHVVLGFVAIVAVCAAAFVLYGALRPGP